MRNDRSSVSLQVVSLQVVLPFRRGILILGGCRGCIQRSTIEYDLVEVKNAGLGEGQFDKLGIRAWR